MQSQQELHLCCAAAPPCPTAALALKELLRSPLLLLPPLVSSFRRACVSRFCTAPAEHVRLLPLSSRLMSSTTSHAGTETFQRYHTSPLRHIRRTESVLVTGYQSKNREHRLPGISASEPTPTWRPDGKFCDILCSLLQSELNSGALQCQV